VLGIRFVRIEEQPCAPGPLYWGPGRIWGPGKDECRVLPSCSAGFPAGWNVDFPVHAECPSSFAPIFTPTNSPFLGKLCHPERTKPQTHFSLGAVSRGICGCLSFIPSDMQTSSKLETTLHYRSATQGSKRDEILNIRP
jgi:hypothetical protein